MIILSIFRFCDGLEFGLFSNTFSCLFSYVDFDLCYFEYLCLLFKFEFEFEKINLFDAKYIRNIMMKVVTKKSLAVSKIDFVYFQVFFFFIFKIIQLTLISTNDHFIDFIHKRTHRTVLYDDFQTTESNFHYNKLNIHINNQFQLHFLILFPSIFICHFLYFFHLTTIYYSNTKDTDQLYIYTLSYRYVYVDEISC